MTELSLIVKVTVILTIAIVLTRAASRRLPSALPLPERGTITYLVVESAERPTPNGAPELRPDP